MGDYQRKMARKAYLLLVPAFLSAFSPINRARAEGKTSSENNPPNRVYVGLAFFEGNSPEYFYKASKPTEAIINASGIAIKVNEPYKFTFLLGHEFGNSFGLMAGGGFRYEGNTSFFCSGDELEEIMRSLPENVKIDFIDRTNLIEKIESLDSKPKKKSGAEPSLYEVFIGEESLDLLLRIELYKSFRGFYISGIADFYGKNANFGAAAGIDIMGLVRYSSKIIKKISNK